VQKIYSIFSAIQFGITETRCISELFEVQTKVGEIQTSTNDSLSNVVDPF